MNVSMTMDTHVTVNTLPGQLSSKGHRSAGARPGGGSPAQLPAALVSLLLKLQLTLAADKVAARKATCPSIPTKASAA